MKQLADIRQNLAMQLYELLKIRARKVNELLKKAFEIGIRDLLRKLEYNIS